MEKTSTNNELLKTEQNTWATWRDHATACSQCMNSFNHKAVLARGCLKGRALYTSWNSAYKAYSATLSRQRRTA